jgi:two-component system chemotaxis response regulator CheB
MTPCKLLVIGGSAGAVDVLIALVPVLTSPRARAIVIVHQRASSPNLLVGVLQAHCTLPVHEVIDKLPLADGAVYVAPPDYHVLVERDATLALSRDPAIHFSRPSIDATFETAADAFGPGVAGVLLTGANDDGATGMAAIERAGGRLAVQAPQSAHSAEMPLAALAICHPELVGTPAQLADWLRSVFPAMESV